MRVRKKGREGTVRDDAQTDRVVVNVTCPLATPEEQ